MDSHKWSRFTAGGVAQVDFRSGADFAALAELDPKRWMVLSMPVDGVRFDRRTLELLDTDHDGRIRVSELIAAVKFLQAKNVNLDDLLIPSVADEKRLADGNLDEDAERVLRYKLHLAEFIENFVNLRRLYDAKDTSIFQTGVLRIDAKELHLCFAAADVEAHAALAEKSECCLAYLQLKRADTEGDRFICAAVTAGRVAGLYVGRNGVFFDRDGKEWEATVTKFVERQVSLAEAFWAPWRKLGETVAETVKKFLGDRQKGAATALTTAAVGTAPNAAPAATGAALASSVAAVGIGVGMAGTAAAALVAAIKGMAPLHLAAAVVAAVLLVSVPSVILTWFKLRRRDLSAILNASGLAINCPLRFSMRLARTFTVCR